MRRMLFCLFFLCRAAHGDTYGNPGCFAIAAEWLNVKAAIDQPYFVINSISNSVANGERFSNEQSRHQGYRIDALYRFPNGLTALDVRWTHIPRFKDQATVTGNNLYGVFTSPQASLAGSRGQASLKEDFNAFTFDVSLAQTLFNVSNFILTFQGGVQYGYVSLFEEAVFMTNQVGGVRPRIARNISKVSGAGPEMEINFAYKIYRWLGIAGRAQGALLIAERHAHLFDNGTLTGSVRVPIDIKNSKYWAIIPTSTMRLGLTLRNTLDFRKWFDCSPFASLGCFNFDLEIGYEVISFYKAIDRLFFTDDVNPGTSFDEVMDLSFHGPYVHLGLSF